MAKPHVLKTIAAVRKVRAALAATGKRLAFVPTMGALHDGHIELVRQARHAADAVLVSIFVNPKQFGPNEDFSRYPRTLPADLKALTGHAEWVFCPSVGEMYPPGFETRVTVPRAAQNFCGRFRPGHFEGVATVVTRLLNIALADVALFGEKDYQQLLVIKRLAADLAIPTQITGVPTVREPGGLAKSSRNIYLAPAERAQAQALFQALSAIATACAAGQTRVRALTALGRRVLRQSAPRFTVQYLGIADATTLDPLEIVDRPARALIAGFLGTTRLIDNIAVEPPSPAPRRVRHAR